jgi:uncharacterized protein YsxB (DUF464 family)
MITVTAKRGAAGFFSFTMEGHAYYADPGSDIVCAAVSTLMQALSVGVRDVLNLEGVKIESSKNQDAAFMSIEWSGGGARAQAIAETVLLTLGGVEASYPDFVRVSLNEVLEEDNKG